MATIIIETEPTVYPNTNNFTAPDIEPFKCNICQEDTENNKVITPCEHIFCGECFFKWMQEKPNCPLCRKEFVNENIMTNINANREELSVISSEISYLKVRASKLKRQAIKMYTKSEMHWERQIRLRNMLESTREEIILERKILKKLRKKRKVSKKINMLHKKEEVEISGLLDYIDGYCTSGNVDELNTYSDPIGETKEDSDELCETLWNNMLLENPEETPEETPEENQFRMLWETQEENSVENTEEIYASDTYTADYSSESSSEDSSSEDSSEEEQVFTFQEWPILEEPAVGTLLDSTIREWPTLNEAYPNETVIFTFGEN